MVFWVVGITSCGYLPIKSRPILKGGFSWVAVDKVVNQSQMVGIEGFVRQQFEDVFADHMNRGDPEMLMSIFIRSIRIKPTAYVIGTAQGAALDLQKDALIASTYSATVDLRVELMEVRGRPQPPLSNKYAEEARAGRKIFVFNNMQAYTSSFSASTLQSDVAGASRNTVLNQVRLQTAMKDIAKQIATNVYGILSSYF
jgi:hypothetical protein